MECGRCRYWNVGQENVAMGNIRYTQEYECLTTYMRLKVKINPGRYQCKIGSNTFELRRGNWCITKKIFFDPGKFYKISIFKHEIQQALWNLFKYLNEDL